ncbi:unnamed protein product, partial [Polarella glacialis]
MACCKPSKVQLLQIEVHEAQKEEAHLEVRLQALRAEVEEAKASESQILERTSEATEAYFKTEACLAEVREQWNNEEATHTECQEAHVGAQSQSAKLASILRGYRGESEQLAATAIPRRPLLLVEVWSCGSQATPPALLGEQWLPYAE